jgi:hypothetical protein
MRVSDIVRIVAAHLDEDEDPPIAALPAAIPFFLIRLTTICVERRDLGVVREFILRAIQLGFNEARKVADYLGIRPEDAKLEIDLLRDEHFISETGGAKRLALLQKGLAAISVNGLTRVSVREAGCYFDGLKRSVNTAPGELVPKRKLSSDTLVLPAVPARPPWIEEISVLGVKAAISNSKSQLPRVLEVTRLGRIIRTNTLYMNAFILLRRGAHRAPLISVNGASDSELAQALGGHPAIELVKSTIEKHERMVKRTLTQQLPSLSTVRSMPSAPLREALARFVSLSDASSKAAESAQADFRSAASNLLMTHWVGAPEAQLLFSYAILTAEQPVTVVAPPIAISLFRLDALESLQILVRRGIAVDLHVAASDDRFSDHEASLRTLLKGVTIHVMPTMGSWYGFSVEGKYELVAASKVATSSTGKSDAFFGALVVASDGGRLLRDVAITSGAPVRVKPKRRAFSPSPNSASRSRT